MMPFSEILVLMAFGVCAWAFIYRATKPAVVSSIEVGAVFKLPQPNDWTADQCHQLKKFLLSETGHALMQRARGMEYNRAVTNAKVGTPHTAGLTVGITETLNWIESLASDVTYQNLSQPSGDTDGKTKTSNGEQDDSALLEKYSP